MINFYRLYNGELDNQHYVPLINQLEYSIISKELEPILHIIKKSPSYAYKYSWHVKNGRWLEAEDVIMTDPEYAYYYAYGVIEGRWPEAESVIKTDAYWWFCYCRYIKLSYEV